MAIYNDREVWTEATIKDLQYLLQTPAQTVKELCTHAKINKWAKYKPVFSGNPSFLDTEGFHKQMAIHPSSHLAGINTYYGLIAGHSTDLDENLHDVIYEYIGPEGGESSPYRLSDFYCLDALRGYDHLATASIYCVPQYLNKVNNTTIYEARLSIQKPLQVKVVYVKDNPTGVNILEFDTNNLLNTPDISNFYVLALITYGNNNYIRALYPAFINGNENTSGTVYPMAETTSDVFQCELPQDLTHTTHAIDENIKLTFFIMQNTGNCITNFSTNDGNINLKNGWAKFSIGDTRLMTKHPLPLPEGTGLPLVIVSSFSAVTVNDISLRVLGLTSILKVFLSLDPFPTSSTEQSKYNFAAWINDVRVPSSPTYEWNQKMGSNVGFLIVTLNTGDSSYSGFVDVRISGNYYDGGTNYNVLNYSDRIQVTV